MQTARASIPSLEAIYNRVKADSQFSLDYLRALDAAIDVVMDARNNAETIEKVCSRILSHLAETGGYDKPLDPAGKLTPESVSAETAVRKFIHALQNLNWSMLPKEHAEEVSERSKEAITALQKLHDTLVDLRWAIIEHDADLEEPEEKAFDNVADLIADLRSG